MAVLLFFFIFYFLGEARALPSAFSSYFAHPICQSKDEWLHLPGQKPAAVRAD